MTTNQLPKIALTFSGGGYRATSFDLGVLSYLNQVKLEENTLLECVEVLSTTSGGTITGARYAWGLKVGESFDDIYYALYYLMGKENLAEMATTRLTTPTRTEKPLKSYIKAYADVYNKSLFDRGTFGAFFSDEYESHLKYVSFNATEFTNGAQFRFEYMEGIKGIHANQYYHIPESVAREVQMGDIVASSTCYPGANEPLNFPNDFALPESIDAEVDELKRLKIYPDRSPYPVGLMDGGLVDNQGVEPVLDAEKHFKETHNIKHNEPNFLDLIMVTDVGSNEMDSAYTAHEVNKLSWWKKLTFKQLLGLFNVMLLIFTVIPLIDDFQIDIMDDNWNEFMPLFLVGIFIGGQFFLQKKIRNFASQMNVSEDMYEPLHNFVNMKFYVFQDMIINRVNSVLMMATQVFVTHISSLNYRLIYTNPKWKNRRITNALKDLEPDELIKNSHEISDKLRNIMPNSSIQEVIRRASTMPSYLFFTEEQLNSKNQESLLDSMIASGQITTCWNLLVYLEEIKNNSENTTSGHQTLQKCHEALLSDWQKFQNNPYWLVEQVNQRTNVHRQVSVQ